MVVKKVHVGVDVGGTNTDAVVLCGQEVVGWAKHVTTEDVTSGVTSAIHAALTQAANNSTEPLQVLRVHIGTTHFVNAVIQRRNLVKVSILRLCGPATRSLPPFCYFPEDLKQVMGGSVHMLSGGFEYDGETEISPVDEAEVKATIKVLKQEGIHNVVIAGTFAPVNNAHELKVAEIFRSEYPGASLTLSHQIGYIGTLERENASALNESLKPLCRRTVGAFRAALDRLGLTCPFFLTQNDGTLISADDASEQPVLTFASGPTNSMRGAAALSKVENAIVIDIGGTTTDVGVLKNGFPRQASTRVKIGDVITNFQMPDVYSIGLGGGSQVEKTKENKVRVGPQSVGYKLTKEALVFGGTTVTASDVAVAHGLVEMGDKSFTDTLPAELVEAAVGKMHDMVEAAIDQVKMSKEDVPVILVGGGTVLMDDRKQLRGTTSMNKPQHFQVANAVGAALSQVSGSVDYTVKLEGKTRDQAIDEAKEKARREAIKAGADPASVQIVDVMEVPLAYLPGSATRIRVKAAGDLLFDPENETGVMWDPKTAKPEPPPASESGHRQTHSVTGQSLVSEDVVYNCMEDAEPDVDPDTGIWTVKEWDIECLSVGAGIMGCGGGGSTFSGRLRCLRLLKQGKTMRVITPERFLQQQEHFRSRLGILPVAFMGAPTILGERFESSELVTGIECMTDLYNVRNYSDDKPKPGNLDGMEISEKENITYIDNYKCEPEENPAGEKKVDIVGVLSAEMGGSNSMGSLEVAAHTGLLAVDCDFMGRAFPELQMSTNYIYGVPAYPTVLTDYKGRSVVVLHVDSPKHLEEHLRVICMQMGCAAAFVERPLCKEEIMTKTVLHSMSRAWRLGRAVLRARKEKRSPIDAVLDHVGGKILIKGKIDDVKRATTGGFARGQMLIEGFTEFTDQRLIILFQNEFLVAKLQHNNKEELLAVTPDLITLVDVETGDPIATEELRYGLRVAAIAIAAPPILCTPQALAVLGPKAFGYDDVEFKPIGIYKEHPPVPLV